MSRPSEDIVHGELHWLGFHHIALVTRDLDATLDFYVNLLGMQAGDIFRAVKGRGRHCFVKPGDTETWGIHFFEYKEAQIFQSAETLKRLAQEPESEDLYRSLPGALQHIAFALLSEEHALALRDKLRLHGVVMTDIYDLGGIRNYIFIDNNGIQLEAAWPSNQA